MNGPTSLLSNSSIIAIEVAESRLSSTTRMRSCWDAVIEWSDGTEMPLTAQLASIDRKRHSECASPARARTLAPSPSLRAS